MHSRSTKKLHDLPYMKSGKTCYTLFAKKSQRAGSAVHSGEPEKRMRSTCLAARDQRNETRKRTGPGGRAAPESGRDPEPEARAGGELRHGALEAVPGSEGSGSVPEPPRPRRSSARTARGPHGAGAAPPPARWGRERRAPPRCTVGGRGAAAIGAAGRRGRG